MKNNTYELMRRERQNSIIKEAYKLFLSKGIGNTTMKDIANEAQISRQTLYSYYKDIDELVIAVEEEVIKNITTNTLLENYECNSPLEYIKYYVSAILKLVDNYPKEMIFICQFDLYFKLYSGDEKLFEGLNQIVIDSNTRAKTLNQIAQGQKEGIIRKDKTTAEIYSTIINLSMGLVQRISLVDSKMDITSETTSKVIRDNFIDMIIQYIEVK